MFRQDHEDQVENPNDRKTENQTDKTCNDLSFRKSRNKAADPGSDRNDRQDNAYEIAKTEIVALFRHKAILSFWDFILLLYSKITEMSTFCKK